MKTDTNSALDKLNEKLENFEDHPNLENAKKVVLSIIKLLDKSIDPDDLNHFKLFTDADGKIRSNSAWFFEDEVIVDRKAIYKIHEKNNINFDFKLYGLNKYSKKNVSWAQALTPNYEDEPFNTEFNIGVDFIINKNLDKFFVVISKNYIVRAVELKGKLTATYQDIFSKWMEIENFQDKEEVHRIIWESFNLSPINRKFYQGIQQRFLNLRDHLVGNNIFEINQATQFATRLIGRVIFTWFLDKKNLINKEMNYFDSKKFSNDSEYYEKKLAHLFFKVLSHPLSIRDKSDLITPYLNGGLFEIKKMDYYDIQQNLFPENFFDDLYDFFHSYNFTTDESTSQFQQVAIDPEMLGRIFENLLAEINIETGDQARNAKGAFYTPREIVDFMCAESLKNYLKNILGNDDYINVRLHQLIESSDREFHDQDHNWRRDWKPYKQKIMSALDELKILDPACGSGAFPIGMLQLLLKVYDRLEPRLDIEKTKLQILEKNIFGIDIEPMAIEITRLRAWLSLVVDIDETQKNIKPLPNLDFKFVCGNSLVSLQEQENLVIGDDPELSNKLDAIRDKYFKTDDDEIKKKNRKLYQNLIQDNLNIFGESERTKQLKSYNPFDYETPALFFDPGYMFGFKKFQIVISNPPYLNSRLMSRKSESKLLREYISSNYEYCKGNWDIYIAFFEKGYEVLDTKGILSFITPDKWLGKPFGDALRHGLLSKINSIAVSGRNVFETANVDSVITFINEIDSNELNIFKNDKGKFILSNKIIKKLIKKPFYLDFLISNNVSDFLAIEENSISLESLVKCEQGCVVSDAYKLKELIIDLDEKLKFDPEKHLKIINTGTILKYNSKWGTRQMTYLGKKFLRPVVSKSDFLKTFPNSYSKKSLSTKIIVKGLNLLDCYLDLAGQIIPGIPTLILRSQKIENLYFSLGILNSKFAFFYIKEKYLASSYNTGTVFTPEMLNNFPIPKNIDQKLKKRIIERVKNRIEVDSDLNKTQVLDFENDQDVYELYKLPNELKDKINNY